MNAELKLSMNEARLRTRFLSHDHLHSLNLSHFVFSREKRVQVHLKKVYASLAISMIAATAGAYVRLFHSFFRFAIAFSLFYPMRHASVCLFHYALVHLHCTR